MTTQIKKYKITNIPEVFLGFSPFPFSPKESLFDLLM
jgi:hypothetical protein